MIYSKLRFSKFKKFVSRSDFGEPQLSQILLNFQTSCCNLKSRGLVVRVYFVHSIFNCIFSLKIEFYLNFQFDFISNSLIRFWILKQRWIMEIQFLKWNWKFNFQFSIFGTANIFHQIQFSTKSCKFSLL